MSMSLLFLGVLAQAGDLNAKIKGTAKCTKAQVPAQLPGRISSKGSLQYHQTSVLSTESGDWFVRLLDYQLSLHPIRFPIICQLSSPPPPIW
jgi:hypothetical protein